MLLPAFVIGIALSRTYNQIRNKKGGTTDVLELPNEERISYIVSSIFMLLVGLSMPLIDGISIGVPHDPGEVDLDWAVVGMHVLFITVLSNIGKMFPAFVYKDEATLRERIAVAISMFPRGEVGAGVLIISISHGISGMVVTVAVLSLCFNLLLTVFFIWAVKKLLRTK